MPERRLEGRIAAVAGGGEPVDRVVADTFGQAGASVESGDARSVEELVDGAAERYGRIDVLVLCQPAGDSGTPLAELSDEAWQRTLDANLGYVFRGMRRALAYMIPRCHGRIIVVSSVEAKLPRAQAAATTAARHGVNGLVKAVAHEVGTMGITVNAILSGISEDDGDPAAVSLRERSALNRATLPEEVAAVAVLLATESMTSVTGCMFPVDGGAMPY
jgi:3-hydroxybutyrate dehydrogenase